MAAVERSLAGDAMLFPTGRAWASLQQFGQSGTRVRYVEGFRQIGHQPLRDGAVNDGRHIHAVAVILPISRLKQSLSEHIKAEQTRY